MSSSVAVQNHTIPRLAEEWLREQLGSFRVVANHRAGSERTGVWHLATSGGMCYLKLNARRARWATELYAYRNWVPVLRPFAPTLLGVLETQEFHGLLLSALDGLPLRECHLRSEPSARVYRAAGEMLARVHSLPAGQWFGYVNENGRAMNHNGGLLPQGMADPVLHYTDILQQALAAAVGTGSLCADNQRLASEIIASLPSISFAWPVPTFFDFTPGNWIASSDGQLLGIIDFEDMGYGLPADSFVRLVVDYFPGFPEGREAFCSGYGRCLAGEHAEQVRIGCLLYGLFYHAHGARRADVAATERARRAFELCAEM